MYLSTVIMLVKSARQFQKNLLEICEKFSHKATFVLACFDHFIEDIRNFQPGLFKKIINYIKRQTKGGHWVYKLMG